MDDIWTRLASWHRVSRKELREAAARGRELEAKVAALKAENERLWQALENRIFTLRQTEIAGHLAYLKGTPDDDN